MKKIYVLLGVGIAMFLSSITPVFADGNWANVGVTINSNGNGNTNYLLYNGGFDVNTVLTGSTSFAGLDFGNVSSLVLNGGIGAGWAANGDYYNGTSFVIYYRAYLTSGTAGTWSSIALGTQTFQSGNNYEYSNTSANIDVLSLVGHVAGTYTLEVVMAKNQFYSGGSWNSMVPGGQSVAYSPSTAGYTATFTVSPATNITSVPTDFKLSVENHTLMVNFPGSAVIQLYTVSGQLIDKTTANGSYTKSLEAGTYIVSVNGKSYKVIIP